MQGLRSATGVLVLSAALLMGSAGGAVAVADSGTSDSASGSSRSGADNPASSSSPNSSVSEPTQTSTAAVDTDEATGAEETAAEESAAAESAAEEGAVAESLAEESLTEEGAAAESVAEEGAAAETVAEESAAEQSVAAVAAIDVASLSSGPVGEQSIRGVLSTVTASESMESEAPAPIASTSTSSRSDTGTVAATSTTETTETSLASSSPTPLAAGTATSNGLDGTDEPGGTLASTPATRPLELADLITSVTTSMVSAGNTMTTVVVSVGDTVATVVITLGNTVLEIPPAIRALFFSPTPITDATALLESVLTSVTESANAVLQLPADVVNMLGMGMNGIGPLRVGETFAQQGVDLVADHGLPAASFEVASPFMGLAPQQSTGVVDRVSGFSDYTPTALAAAFRAPLMAAPASVPARAGEYQSLFDRAFGAMLVPLSLWALATGAFPGLVGLLVVFGVGARVGYRQAKAGLALKMVGIARFAGSGPLGVVRSGSLVEVHQRGLKVGGQRVPQLYRVAGQVA